MFTDTLEPTPTPLMTPAAGPAPDATSLRESPASTPLTLEDLERTRQLLMRNIGPIAKVVITRAAIDGVTLQEFLARVASSVLIETARTRFVREAGTEFAAAAPRRPSIDAASGPFRRRAVERPGPLPRRFDRVFGLLAKLVPGGEAHRGENPLGEMRSKNGELTLEGRRPLILVVRHSPTLSLEKASSAAERDPDLVA
jgi:hypothetical protein